MLKPYILAFSIILCHAAAIAQSPGFTIKQDTITFHLNKISGIGPSGFSSVVPSAKDAYPEGAEERKLFTLKNIPVGLTDVKEYYYPLNLFQFTYQNYLAGVLSKTYLLNKANGYGWDLADTIKLSRKALKCSLSIITGVNQQNNPIYIIDANNNNDLSDDLVRPLLTGAQNEDLIVSSSVKVNTDRAIGKVIKVDTILVNIAKSFNPNRTELNISFPEFAYSKFKYRGQYYLMCNSGSYFDKYITVLPDRPYFTSVTSSNRISKGQFFKIGDSDCKLLDVNINTGEVILTGTHLTSFSTVETSPIAHPDGKQSKSLSDIVSTSVGYQAPLVVGTNINTALSNYKMISTAALKGKYVYLDFWGTFCVPCIKEIPNIREAYQKFGRDKFEVIGILDEKDLSVAQKLLKDNKVIWPNVSMQSKTTDITGYGKILSFPTSYLIGPDGEIISVNLRGAELVSKLSELIK